MKKDIAKDGELPEILRLKIEQLKLQFPEHEKRLPYPNEMSIQRQMEYYLNAPKVFFLCGTNPIVLNKEIVE